MIPALALFAPDSLDAEDHTRLRWSIGLAAAAVAGISLVSPAPEPVPSAAFAPEPIATAAAPVAPQSCPRERGRVYAGYTVAPPGAWPRVRCVYLSRVVM